MTGDDIRPSDCRLPVPDDVPENERVCSSFGGGLFDGRIGGATEGIQLVHVDPDMSSFVDDDESLVNETFTGNLICDACIDRLPSSRN